jgi:cytochrome c oxidase subunit 1
MSSVGRLFAIAAILVLVLGVARWPTLGTAFYTFNIKNRGYGFGPDHYAFFLGAVFAFYAAVYYWFPLLSSRSLIVWTSHLHFWLSAVAAFGFLLLAPGIEALLAPQGLGSSSQRAIIAVLGVAIISTMLFLVAQFIFFASFFWTAAHGNKT